MDRIQPLLKDGDVVGRLKQFRLRWQESGDLTYLGKALVDAVVEIEALRAANSTVLAEREACALIADQYDQGPGDDSPVGPVFAAQVTLAQSIAGQIRARGATA